MAFMGIMAVVNVYMSRNNVPIAIIQMVNNTYLDANRNTSIKETTMCFGNASDDSGYSEPQVDGPLMLNQKQQTVLVACYFWGYTANQLTAGYFAYRFGFKLALGIGIGIGSVLTYLFPYIIMIPNYGFILAVITRVIIGFFHVCKKLYLTLSSKKHFRHHAFPPCKARGQNGRQVQKNRG